MTNAVKVLLSEAIDYAGLFPPAKLGMAEAVDAYQRYRQGPEAWILGRFVVPAVRLVELREELETMAAHDFRLAVTGSGGSDRSSWQAGLEKDAQAMNAFQEKCGAFAAIEAFETRVPDNRHLDSYVSDLAGFGDADLFMELHWGDDMGDALAVAAEGGVVMAKARTGGVEPTAFPASREVASFIQHCTQLYLPFKFTAGLHHAAPTDDSGLGVRMHGFVNVFAACALSLEHELALVELIRVLDDDAPSAFRFEGDELAWGEFRAHIDSISEARELLKSFGSCSVLEPLQGLRKAGLLSEARI